ncbi:unnamed protein product [Chondrus crispus]|uniref:Serine/threonine-protein phosphatase 2A activator n=1 Tax=Chondrus crispus TaxID=2769 RepID=R7QQ91_CHOCR|nr:unnamed protein product [Chondrus crispus]CDF39928.1 unnamed protein product [Chondrus crispus]|eukprot:XP_005710222.1 unnamed protein product [Chondrus crispus]
MGRNGREKNSSSYRRASEEPSRIRDKYSPACSIVVNLGSDYSRGESTLFVATMVRPEKRIKTEADLQVFLQSRQFAELWAFLLRLNQSVKNKKRSAVSRSDVSKSVLRTLEMLEKLEEWIHDLPPVKQPSRFGNAAFRSWHSRLCDRALMLMSPIVDAVGEGEYTRITGTSMEMLIEELAEYLKTSFGNETRIDYGSGHEAHFLVMLYCLWKIGVYGEEDDEDLVLLVFQAYLNVTRLLQREYMLEPAGSHGVWGLDDYSFLPFLWGSSQLEDSKRIPPSVISDDAMLAEHREEYLYLDAIAFIKELKTGPFFEHSRMLFDISQVKEGWPKINQGMIKMYKGEVWKKRPVIQHFLFGSVFKYQSRANEESNSNARLEFFDEASLRLNQDALRDVSAVKACCS